MEARSGNVEVSRAGARLGEVGSSDVDLVARMATTRRDLKVWETDFLRAHGRQPNKDDAAAAPGVKEMYGLYRSLKSKLEKENATGLKEETALVTRLGNVREELAKLERDVEARARHEGDRADAAKELRDLEAACKELQKGDAKRKEALDDAAEAAADAEADAARKKKAARSLTNGKKASFQEVQAAVDAAARGAERAARADATLAALAADRETLETRVADADAEAKRAAAAIGDHASGNASRQAMKKAIDANVNLRSARSARAAAASDVADLEDDRSGDAARRRELAARHDKLARDLNRLVSRRGEYVGRRSNEASVAK